MIQPSSPSFVPYSQFGSRLRLLQFIIMRTKKKKKTKEKKIDKSNKTENAVQIFFDKVLDEFSCCSVKLGNAFRTETFTG